MAETPNALAQWFPLVPRARPICAPLEQRIGDVTSMAHRAKTVTEAAAALNLTALIASDIGAADLASEMCWRQYLAFTDRAPLDRDNAGLAMEPLINLARLSIRDGDGDRAHKILDQAFTAATDGTTATIDGNLINFAGFATDAESLHQARERLWVALLADGTRALTRAGRWTEALQAIKHRNGIGERLLDGRQTAIITHYITGELASAITLIADTAAADPWEQALTAYLETCCTTASGTANAKTCTNLVEQFRQLDVPMEQGLFRIRLGLSILEIVNLLDADTEPVVKDLEWAAQRTGDAYAARELLACTAFRTKIDSSPRTKLEERLERSGLGPDTSAKFKLQRLQVTADVGLVQLQKLLDRPVVPSQVPSSS
ncbi:hypothetical protein GCM10029992_36270 [Glycomyces albus]